MEVWVTIGAMRRANLHSNPHHQHTITQTFLQAGRPSCCPTNSVRALKGECIDFKVYWKQNNKTAHIPQAFWCTMSDHCCLFFHMSQSLRRHIVHQSIAAFPHCLVFFVCFHHLVSFVAVCQRMNVLQNMYLTQVHWIYVHNIFPHYSKLSLTHALLTK